jgi:hypothetical protein
MLPPHTQGTVVTRQGIQLNNGGQEVNHSHLVRNLHDLDTLRASDSDAGTAALS